METRERLRLGIMCRGTMFPEWQARCLQKLLEGGSVEPALLIIDTRPPLPPSTWRRRLKTLLRLRINFFSIYDRYFVHRLCIATRLVDLAAILAHVPPLHCEVIRKGKFSEYFKDEDLAVIREYRLDFILRFGFNIIRGEILNAARYGVWSYHHGDELKYRGAPPCFWEIYRGEPETGAILQRLTERLDRGIVLKKGFFKTIHRSYPRNRDAAHFLGVDWPAEVCKDILSNRAAYLQGPPSRSTAPIYLRPTNLQMILFATKQIRNTASYFLHSLYVPQRTGFRPG